MGKVPVQKGKIMPDVPTQGTMTHSQRQKEAVHDWIEIKKGQTLNYVSPVKK